MIRSFIKKYPYLYELYSFFKSRGNYYRLPDKSTDIHITAFQRSGNTFAANLSKCVFVDKKIVTHIHAIASLKKALRYKIPIVVIIRDPNNTIASSVLRKIDGRGENLKKATDCDLNDYLLYYSFVLSNIESLNIIQFETLINNPFMFLERVSELLEIPLPEHNLIQYLICNTYENLNNDERTDGTRNLKSEYKESKKKEIIKRIAIDNRFNQCCSLYQKIINQI